MNKKTIAVFLLAVTFFAGHALAQDQDGQAMFAYATYFVCSPDGESRADEIINSSFKPHYDASVEHGDIQSWSWMQHFVGGEWRRILTMGAPDHKTLMRARTATLADFDDRKVERAAEEFNDICPSHQDYLWDILAQTP